MIEMLFDQRSCILGEGPLWHPERNQLFWFDIINKKMMSRVNSTAFESQFDHHASAARWISQEELLIDSEVELFRFNAETHARTHVIPLETENNLTRSNDGRADPWGGFWIGTMGKNAETEAGAIYRFYRGSVEQLYSEISIANSICFSPDKSWAYYTDTVTAQIMRQKLDNEGWPKDKAEVFLDLSSEGLNPDGSVVDAQGCLWNAQWGASRIARYSTNGTFMNAYDFPATLTSCPAFGGQHLSELFVTSATIGLRSPSKGDGCTYRVPIAFVGQREHQIIL